ncbi:MAG: ribosomal protein methylthiotransferase RimO [Actinomycetota bacterium]
MGCARNETDSNELAARLAQAGWELTDDAASADAVMINTCGFVDAAKKDSIDALLAASDLKSDGKVKAVVAVGCMAERYGEDLAADLPEADAILGFDQYQDIGATLARIVGGEKIASHAPIDRRTLSATSPTDRQTSNLFVPGHSSDQIMRVRLDSKPYAPLKIASGCDRRCSFCAIPRFRGSYVSRRPTDIIAEAVWLSERGVKELFLVSENSTSYGKDLGDVRLLESLLPALGSIDAIERIRVSYLQPAEMRPGLLEAMVNTPKVASYFDLSFQHASAPVLRRMRRFGSSDEFLALVQSIRAANPEAGVRSNVIVGFPGETEEDLNILCDFITEAQMDVVGIFGYSDEQDTEALTLDGKLPQREIDQRVEYVTSLVDEIISQRAEDRIGQTATVIVESLTDGIEGRTEFQGPETDGMTTLIGISEAAIGDVYEITIVDSEGADLVGQVN